jgi:branched-chain amino acid transport system permease protein
MVTIALAEIARIVVSNWKLMGSAQGITLPLKGSSWYYMQWTSKIPYYYIILAMAVLSTILVMILDRSRFGYYAKAVKMDEVAARNRGIDAYRIKQLAFSLNAVITSLVGTFFAQYVMYISPDSLLQLTTSVLIAVIPIVGGLGTVTGPIIGGIFIFPLTEWLRALFGGLAMGVNFILFGAAVIFVVLVEPRGFHALLLRLQRFARGDVDRQRGRG